MNRLRATAVVVGVLAAAGGLAMVYRPSLAGTVPLQAAFVNGVGLAMLVQAVRELASRYRASPEYGTVDDESAEAVPAEAVPGRDFDDLTARTATATDARAEHSRRDRLQRRLGAAAEGLLRRHSRGGDVRGALEGGTWTDDPAAAAYFAGDHPDDEPARPILGGLISIPESSKETLSRRARHAADELAALVGVERGEDA